MNPLTAVAELLAPSRCVRCGVRAVAPWCPTCRVVAESYRLGSACRRCAVPEVRAGDGHGCWPAELAVARAWVPYRYGGEIADAVVLGKVAGRSSVWAGLGRRLALAIGGLPPNATVTWVPTEPRRRRDRGFDHAELLARAVADQLGTAAVALLRARRGAPDQGSRDPARRTHLDPATFRPLGQPPPGPVVLVDDVLTTGATVRAAAGALRARWDGPLAVAAVARAGRHGNVTDRSRPRASADTSR